MKRVLLAAMVVVCALSLAAIGTYANFADIENSKDNSFETGSVDLQLGDYNEGFGELGDSVSQTWHYAGTYPPGMAPGDSLESAVYLQNIGNLEGDRLDIQCLIVNAEIDNDTDAENEAENVILIAQGGGIDNDFDGLIDEDSVDGIDNDEDGLIDEDPNPVTGPIPVEPNHGVYDKDRVMIINYMKYQNASATDIVEADGTMWDPAYIVDSDNDGIITLYDFKTHGVSNLPPPVSGLANFSMKVTFGDASVDLNQYQGDRTEITLIFILVQ